MKGDTAIIDNYRDLMISDYMEIVSITKDTTLEEIDKQVKIIALLTKKSEEEVLAMPIPDYQKLSSKLAFLEGDAITRGARFATSYSVGGFELVPVTDMRKVITSQYIDFQTLHQAGFEEYFVQILSCILIPKGKTYCQDYDLLEVQDAIRNGMSVQDGASVYAFFLTSCKRLLADTLTSSLKMAKKIRNKEKRERMTEALLEQMRLLAGNGDGSQV